jgi:hypothetical protein
MKRSLDDDYLSDLLDSSESDEVGEAGKGRRSRRHLSEAEKDEREPEEKKIIAELDKLQLVLHRDAYPSQFFDLFAERLGSIRKVKKRSSKGAWYKRNYILHLPSGTKVVFSFEPTMMSQKFGMCVTLNPSKMTKADARALRKAFKQMFLTDRKRVMQQLLIKRADLAFDFNVDMSTIIITLGGSYSEAKFYVQTTREAKIQTWYAGSVESQERWVAYDQVASDQFKIEHGELPSLPRSSARDDAEVMANSARFEQRRVFKEPLSLDVADDRVTSFDRFNVYEIDDQKVAAGPDGFSLYLDSVRFRGIHGARQEYSRNHTGRAANKLIQAHEKHLQQCLAPWWDKSKLDPSIRHALEKTPAWKALRHIVRDETNSAKVSY